MKCFVTNPDGSNAWCVHCREVKPSAVEIGARGVFVCRDCLEEGIHVLDVAEANVPKKDTHCRKSDTLGNPKG